MSLPIMAKRVILTLMFFGSLCLSAQGVPHRKESVIWENPNVILPIHPIQPSASHSIRYESPSGRIIKTIPVPTGAYLRDHLNGILYAFGTIKEMDTKDKDVAFTRHLLWRREGENWVIDAMIEAPRAVFFPIIPLKNGKYLLPATRPIIEDDNGFHLFGIYRKNKQNHLELEKNLTDAFSKPHWPKAGDQSYSLEDSTRMGLFHVCRTNSKIVIHFPDIGWFFVFSPEDGRFLRKARVFLDVSEDAIRAGKEFGPVGLGFEPRKDGRIIFSTMSKDYVLLAIDLFPRPLFKPEFMDKDQLLAEYVEKYKEVEDQRIKKWPHVLWWEFDPDTGIFDRIPTPDGFPDKLKGREDFYWRIRADGTLVRFDRFTDIIEPPKKKWRILEMFDMR